MSGFEIAGIVLGAFPLAIEGLKAYENLGRGWESWRDIKREYKQCLHELQFHRLTFTQHLRYLLLPLVVEPSRIEALIAQPRGTEWEDNDLDQALRQRLNYSYDLYFDVICSLQSLMEDAEEYLRIESPELQARLTSANDSTAEGSSNQPSSSGRSALRENISYQKYRFKFSRNKSTRNKFFDDLQKYNDRLEKLLDSSDKVRGLQQNMSTSLSQPAGSTSDAEICRFWQHAQKVYIAFSKAWTCNCRSQHQTQLMLQQRIKGDKEMRLILRAGVPDDKGLPAGHGVTICQSTDPEKSRHCQTPAPLLLPKMPEHRKSIPGRSALSKFKAYIDIGARKTKLNPREVRIQDLPQSDLHSTTTDNQLITDLCHKLQEGFKSSTSSEYLQGENSKYYICARPQSSNKLQVSQPSLEDMLRDAGYKLDRRQRYTMSHILASSFVQLQNTSWIVSSWQKSSIVFPEQTGNTNIPDHREPFITHRFCERTMENETNLPEQDLGNLAVTLLELCFGKVIEDYPKREKLPPGLETADIKAIFDLAAASKWLKDVEGEAGPDFANAIRWCLNKHKTFHDKANWRHEMFQQVVRPLDRAMNSWTSQAMST